ncbi:MAG: sigma-70 family RNA polymerase sigma factor [Bacteroidota bacterium]
MKSIENDDGIFKLDSLKGFRHFYYQNSDKVYNFFMYHLDNSEVSEDLVQELFIYLWTKRDTITIRGPIENYIMSCAKHALIKYYRTRGKEKLLYVDFDIEEIENTTPEILLQYAETKQRMVDVLKKIPKKTREIFLLSRNHGLSNKEIARRTSLSEKSVEYHIGKTLKRLRRYIALFSFFV